MRSVIPVAAAIAVVLLAGCGSSGDDQTSSPTKAEFVKRATAICHREREDMLARLGTYFAKHQGSGESENELFADSLRAVYLPTVETELAKIRALGAPEGDEAEVDAFLEAEQKAIDVVAERDSVSGGRFTLEEYFADAAKLARAYGIPACGNSEPPG